MLHQTSDQIGLAVILDPQVVIIPLKALDLLSQILNLDVCLFFGGSKLYNLKITHQSTFFKIFYYRRVQRMCKDMMVKYIRDTLEDLSENTVSDLYWFLKMELGM